MPFIYLMKTSKLSLNGWVEESGGSWSNCKSNMWKKNLCSENFWNLKFFEIFFIESYYFYHVWTRFYKSQLFCYIKMHNFTSLLGSVLTSVNKVFFCNMRLKPNYSTKQSSLLSFLLTWCNNTTPNWPGVLSILVPFI